MRNPCWHFFHFQMNVNDCYKAGFILKPHGLKGEVTVMLDPDLPLAFNELDSVFIDIGDNLVPHVIHAVSVTHAKAIVKFEDIDSQAAANLISKKALYLPKSTRPKSGRGKFYDDEVVGFEVHDENHGELGKVVMVSQAGLNRLLSVDHDGREVLIPVNSPFITNINKGKKRISVSLPEGFLDL